MTVAIALAITVAVAVTDTIITFLLRFLLRIVLPRPRLPKYLNIAVSLSVRARLASRWCSREASWDL